MTINRKQPTDDEHASDSWWYVEAERQKKYFVHFYLTKFKMWELILLHQLCINVHEFSSPRRVCHYIWRSIICVHLTKRKKDEMLNWYATMWNVDATEIHCSCRSKKGTTYTSHRWNAAKNMGIALRAQQSIIISPRRSARMNITSDFKLFKH